MSKLLVTGGNGLVGSAINSDVKIGREFDLRKSDICDSVFKINKPSHVIHCAGKVGGIGGNITTRNLR
jgi:dTDP-4-dehydrorhamnose reductase